MSLPYRFYFITNLKDTFTTPYQNTIDLIQNVIKLKFPVFLIFVHHILNFTVSLTEFPTDRLLYESYYYIGWYFFSSKMLKEIQNKNQKNSTHLNAAAVLKIYLNELKLDFRRRHAFTVSFMFTAYHIRNALKGDKCRHSKSIWKFYRT